jgi:four helix bundle protein
MKKENPSIRIKSFVIRIIRMVNYLPELKASNIIANQLTKSTTSIGANYRTACLTKSKRDFIHKLKIVEKETDETLYWIELIEECNFQKPEKIQYLKVEAKELLAIIIASLKTAQRTANEENHKT